MDPRFRVTARLVFSQLVGYFFGLVLDNSHHLALLLYLTERCDFGWKRGSNKATF